jgi:hypothetical protein
MHILAARVRAVKQATSPQQPSHVRTRTDAMISVAQRCDVLSDNVVRDLKRDHARPRRINPTLIAIFCDADHSGRPDSGLVNILVHMRWMKPHPIALCR